MKRFQCECGQRIFFENTRCEQCQRILGFDPEQATMVTLQTTDNTAIEVTDTQGQRYRHCQNRIDHQACNWLLPGSASSATAPLCFGCSLNGTIPNLEAPANLHLWRTMERAKRRLLYGLLGLHLPMQNPPLTFHFLQDQRSNPLVAPEHINTGHYQGHITINLREADDVQRESARIALHEANRTLLGHFRHESGHYYWLQLLPQGDRLEGFRALFGDERRDYQQALAGHHDIGPPARWQDFYVSAYASSHPHEDWAETWAHYLHITDALESARVNGLLPAPQNAVHRWIDQWLDLSISLNEVNRSIGVDDAYPYVLTNQVVAKLEFIHSVVAPLAATAPTGTSGAASH